MLDGWIEVTVRYIQPSIAAGPTTILVGPCERGDLTLLSITAGPADAALLDQELRGDVTARSAALALLGRVASALGGKATAAYLIVDHPGSVRGALGLSTSMGRLELNVEPGQALAAAIGLNLPLLADRAMFSPAVADPNPDTRIQSSYRLPHWNDP